MTIKRITNEQVQEPPPGSFSNCLLVGNQIFISGMVGEGSDAYEQARNIFAKFQHMMETAGGSMADIVKFTVFLTDIKDRPRIHKARQEFFEGDFPTSTLIEISKLVQPKYCVEIEAIGVIGASKE